MVAANVFETMGKVSDKLRCIVVPATQHIYKMALEEGLIEIFVKAGCFVSGPTCGACLGMSCGVLAPGEVCVSTTNRNFKGRMGNGGIVHLVSPATAALTAIKGVITEPTEELCNIVFTSLQNPAKNRMPRDICGTVPTGWADVSFKAPDYCRLLARVDKRWLEQRPFPARCFICRLTTSIPTRFIPAKYLTETDKKVFGEHCLENTIKDRSDFSSRRYWWPAKTSVADRPESMPRGRSRRPVSDASSLHHLRAYLKIICSRMGFLCITLPKGTVDLLMKNKPETLSVDLEEGVISWSEKFGQLLGRAKLLISVLLFPIIGKISPKTAELWA